MTCQKHPIWPGRLNDKPHKRSTGKTAPMQLNCLMILNIIKLLRTKLMVVPTQTTVFPIIHQRLLSKDNSNASQTVGAAFTSQVWSCNKDCIYVPWRRHAQEMCVCVSSRYQTTTERVFWSIAQNQRTNPGIMAYLFEKYQVSSAQRMVKTSQNVRFPF